MLVDLANHVANAYEQMRGKNRDETLARLRALWDAEWDRPTDTATGEIVK